MQVAVWETYVLKDNGGLMHFDILVPQELKDINAIYQYGKEYLKTKGQESQSLDAKECQFCHIEEASADVVKSIEEKGYLIIEMQGCN